MSDNLPAVLPANLPAEASPAQRLLAAWLAGRTETTRRAYAGDLAYFAAFLGDVDPGRASIRLLSMPHGDANATALAFRARMIELHLAPATTNRRLAALRSLVALANTLGMVPWELKVQGVRSEAYRDTRGPGRAGVRKLLAKAAERSDLKGLRDRAILACLTDLALRRAEVCRLDLDDFDPASGTVAVLGKGRTQRELRTLPVETAAALSAWVAARGNEPGALFTNMDRARKGSGRLSGEAIRYLVGNLGRAVGVKARPHSIRHAAISEALDQTRGNVREVKAFSRHADVGTVLRYDDARTDAAGAIARKVARAFR